MSTVNEQDIAEWKERFVFDGRVWKHTVPVMDKNGDESIEYETVSIVDVPKDVLLREYEDMVINYSEIEVTLYELKESYSTLEAKIIEETDFKALYGANNQKVRDNHVKKELSDMVSKIKKLERGLNFIRNYIPLLREVLRCKK